MKKKPKRRPARKRDRVGAIPSVQLFTTFDAGPGFVTAVIHLDENSTVGLKFESPDQLLEFFTGLMEHAVIAWPDNPFIQYYLSEED